MRRNDAMWRRLLRKTTRPQRRPLLEQFEDRLLLTTFIVNTTDDNPANAVEKSLRNAILASNAAPSTTTTPNQIQFAISSTGAVQTINLQQALPTVTAPVVIDGLTEPNATTSPLIAISGANLTTGGDGLDITGGNSTVRGLSIVGFANGSGIVLSGSGNDTVSNNYLGVIPAGTAVSANGNSGIVVGSGADNSTLNNNVIGGNIGNGITIDGTQGGSATTVVAGTKVTNNKVGVNPLGTAALPNRSFGISVVNATGSIIGGAGATNVVSANYLGIYLGSGSDTTTIQGNLIGTDITGGNALANQNTRANGATLPQATPGDGIYLAGSNNVLIGGTASGTGNTISGNTAYGINMAGLGSTAVTIEGNAIGVARASNGATGGGLRLPNATGGIRAQGTGNVISNGNIISGNGGPGITADFFSKGLVIQGNFIGTDTNFANLGNAGPGIETLFGSSGTITGGTLVNGTVSGTGNVIAYNTIGVDIGGGNANTILSNSISNDATQGILVETNNFNPNNGILPLTLTTAVSNKNASTFTGSFTGAPGTYTVQFFDSPQLNAAGVAEGATLIGTTSLNVTTPNGQAFTLPLTAGFEPGGYVTATITDSAGNSSQFSPGILGTGQGPNDVAPVVTVTSAPTTVAAGDNVTYTFTVQNPSAITDRGVSFSAVLPAGTSLFSGSASVFVFSNAAGGFVVTQVPLVVTAGVANVSLGDLLAKQSSTITLTLTTGAASVPSYTLTGQVAVTIPTFDAVTASATTTVTASDDLYTFTNGPAAPIGVGQNATFQITVGNNGPSSATNVQFLDNLPTGTTFVSATASNGASFSQSNGQVTANLGTLASGQLVTINLVVGTNASTPSTITNTAAASSLVADSDTTNNVSTASATVIASSDLTIASETASPTTVAAGQPVTYTFTVANNGPSPATGVVLTDNLPAGVTFLSGSAAGGTVTVANGVATATLGNLAAGATATVTITVLTGGAGTLTDSAVVTSLGTDPNPNNNTSSATIVVSPLTDLAVSLSGPVTPAIVGELFVYTAVVTNSGPSAATGVVFTDTLFAGAQFLGAAGNGAVGSASGGVVTVPLGTIAAGQSVVVTIAVNPSQVGNFTSTASVRGIEPDTNAANNTATVATTVAAPQFAIGFSQPSYTVLETSKFATITLVRLGDQTGEVTVLFSTTVGGNAVPGVNYTPVSTLVTFPSGVSTETVTFPVLADPYDSTNENVNLLVTSPTGQAIFGGGATSGSATLTIINTDPLLNGPSVTDVRIIGPADSITGVEIQTTGKLNPTTATLATNYSFTSTTSGAVIPVSTVAYNPNTGIVLLLPSSPLPAGQIFTLRINGSGANGVTDLAGNPLNGSLVTGTPGTDFALNIARAKTLSYTDQNGSRVTLKLTGPGVIDLNQATSGLVERLQITGATKATRLTGTVKGGNHRTSVGSVTGLKLFGTVKTSLPTPPFYVTNTIYPNLQSLNNGASSDTLLGGSTATTTTTVRAKAVSTGTTHPTARTAQVVHTTSLTHKSKATR